MSITELETKKISPLWQELRDAPPGAVSQSGIPELIAHFEMRSRHLRVALEAPIWDTFVRLGELLDDSDELENRLLRRVAVHPKELFNDRGLNREQKRAMQGRLRAMPQAELRKHARSAASNFAAEYKQVLERIDLKTALRDGHNKALSAAIAGGLRETKYAEMQFRVVTVSVEHPPLIQGDSVALFSCEGSGEYRPFYDGSQALASIIIPLEPTRFLMGGRGTPPSSSLVRCAAARCSFEQFIAASESVENMRLLPEIGSWAAMISESDLQGLQVALLDKFLA